MEKTKKSRRGRPVGATNTPDQVFLQLRLPAGGEELLRTAAEKAGLPLATWTRLRLVEIAKKELRNAD